MLRIMLLVFALFLSPGIAHSEDIGCVDSSFNLIGPDHKICVEVFDDPLVSGVSCHLSRARKGGLSGWMGLATDTSDASIACRQVGEITLPRDLKQGESVFKKSTSILFKTMQVVRFFDKKRNVLIYLVYSDQLIDGSPKNSVSTVPLTVWIKN